MSKCDRQYPCSNCVRRRRPADCVFPTPLAQESAADQRQPLLPELPELPELPGPPGPRSADLVQPSSIDAAPQVLAESFGYYENSRCNTMALIRQMELDGGEGSLRKSDTSACELQRAQQDMARMPNRQVIDALIRCFVSDLNWMKQVVHGPCFLDRYQRWWDSFGTSSTSSTSSVDHVEFATLILRVCCYTAQFLPSRSHPIDTIAGLSLSSIRTLCSDVGDCLAEACLKLDWEGSLVRVQHLLFSALRFSCEGRTDCFWEGIALASQAAQKAGLHTENPPVSGYGVPELDKGMCRRTLCSLYILDSHLSRQLDRIPFLPDEIIATAVAHEAQHGEPDMFTERLMQAQLGKFWRAHGPQTARVVGDYEPIQEEQRYDKFCTEYLPTLPPSLALQPDTRWDQAHPKVAMQRHLLHVTILDSICWIFKPVLLLSPSQIECLAPYKQMLLQAQKQRLAAAALQELHAVNRLHDMFGGSHTRFGAIIFNFFEAAVVLSLCAQTDFLAEPSGKLDILGLRLDRLTREECMLAARGALLRLQVLAEVSSMAASGAHVLARLYVNVAGQHGPSTSRRPSLRAMSPCGSGHDLATLKPFDQGLTMDLISAMLSDQLDAHHPDMTDFDFSASWTDDVAEGA